MLNSLRDILQSFATLFGGLEKISVNYEKSKKTMKNRMKKNTIVKLINKKMKKVDFAVILAKKIKVLR